MNLEDPETAPLDRLGARVTELRNAVDLARLFLRAGNSWHALSVLDEAADNPIVRREYVARELPAGMRVSA